MIVLDEVDMVVPDTDIKTLIQKLEVLNKKP